jgi:hypothetical protein
LNISFGNEFVSLRGCLSLPDLYGYTCAVLPISKTGFAPSLPQMEKDSRRKMDWKKAVGESLRRLSKKLRKRRRTGCFIDFNKK